MPTPNPDKKKQEEARKLLGTGMAGSAADKLKAARKKREQALRDAGAL